MKKTLIIAATLLAPFALQAQSGEGKGPKGGGKKGGRPIPAEILEKFDTDGDGTLNEEERKAARSARRELTQKRRAEMLAKYDVDKDGKLSPEEQKAAMLDRFDADKDGKLSDAERETAKKEMRRPRGAREGGPRGKGKGKKRPESEKAEA